MVLETRIIERFEEPVPYGKIRVVGEEHIYREGESEYALDKSPFEWLEAVDVVVDGRSVVLEDDDVTLITDDESRPTKVVFDETEPDVGSTFAVTYVARSLLQRHSDSFSDAVDPVSTKSETVVRSHQLQQASDQELDLIGDYFGELGRRDGRTNDEYRSVLRGVVKAFSGRGTKQGMKVAIATALNIVPDDIEIEENYEQTGYNIRINTDEQVVTSSLRTLIEASDPSGVELLNPPVVQLGGADVSVTRSDLTITSDSTGLGSGTLGDDQLG